MDYRCRLCGKTFQKVSKHLSENADFEHKSIKKNIESSWVKVSNITEYNERCFCGGVISVNKYRKSGKITWENTCSECAHVWSTGVNEDEYD